MFFPRLLALDDSAPVHEKISVKGAVTELSGNVAMPDGVEANEGGEDLCIAGHLGSLHGECPKATLIERRISQHTGSKSQLMAEHGSSGATLRLEQSLRVEVGTNSFLLSSSVVGIQRNVLILHFYRFF